MKRHSGRVAAALAAAAALGWSTTAAAQGAAAPAPTAPVAQAPPVTVAPVAQVAPVALAVPVAQTVPVARAAPAPVGAETTVYTGPNRALIGTGIITFGLAYVPAVVIAGESSLPADHHLFVPVAGPWINIANRPRCGEGNIACDTETTNKVLLVVDGVFQGLGVLTTLAGFVTPERVVTTTPVTGKAQGPTIHFAPTPMGSGVGAAAFGSF
jgi:hypothetical protein